MGATGDTLMRHWEILSRIPRDPRAISTAAIRDALKGLGYQVTDRTVQRNLEVLSTSFPLKSTRRGQTNYWSWMAAAPSRTVPALDPTTALAITLARDYLRPLLPPSTLKLLDPYFRSAAEALARDYAVNHARLTKRLRVLARGPRLLPAQVKPQVQDAIYEALLR